MKWYHKLHWRIIIGMIAGLIYGIAAASFGWSDFTLNWISPWGTIFINLLKTIAVPLVITSLISGVSSLSDLKKLSRMGGKTIAIYIATTLIAVVVGLVIANVFKPGNGIPQDLKDKLQASYSKIVESKQSTVAEVKQRRPLQPIIDMVPANMFSSVSDNKNMLQVVFLAIIIGIALIQIKSDRAAPVINLIDVLGEVVIKIVDIIMIIAPIGVFSLIANTIISVAGDDISQIVELVRALGFYCVIVLLGLAFHALIIYPTMLKLFTKMSLKTFMKGIAPAQLLAFSSSSSGATLPLTMERCEKNLGASEEVTSFVLPLGATINMDGTALYQAVAAIFIAQATGINLGLGPQMTIIFTAVLASIGTAAVPGAGIIMLVVILESVGIPSSGIALILGVDRILDMVRTTVNVTGDAAVCMVVAQSEGQLGEAHVGDDGEPVVHFSRQES